MDEYDVVAIGGGIGGSVAARFSAEYGLNTLLIEKSKTPRNKPCSGIQFPYLEKLLGAKAPPDKLCTNELYKVEMITPSGKVTNGRMQMLNFWRSTFDSWLNTVAADAGADFQDECKFLDFHPDNGRTVLEVEIKGEKKIIAARYVIGADGLNSPMRRKLRPQDFENRAVSGTINYYFVGDADLDPNTLYMFYDREFAPIMFAWAYLKDEQWVIGTGSATDLKQYAERFLNFVCDKYRVRGELVKREGFASPVDNNVYLGTDRILLTGDAAGLVDLHRGLGMDNAALSGRLAVKAVIESEKNGGSPLEAYQRLMKRLVRLVQTNAGKQAARYSSNESLENSMSSFNILKGGVLMLAGAQVNKVLPPEKVILLPP